MSTVKVREVKSITLKLLKTNPPELLIHVLGDTLYGGFTGIKLEPYIYVKPPADGVWEFDMVGQPPTGIHDGVITPVTAEYIWKKIPKGLKGIKVHSASNYKTVMLKHSENGETLQKDIEIIKAQAWVNIQPIQQTKGGTLTVSIDYNSNNHGFHNLKRAAPQGINPKILLLELTDEPELIFIANPRHSSYSEGLSSIDQYTSIDILYHGSIVAAVTEIPVVS